MTTTDTRVRGATANDDEAIAILAFEYLSWADGRLLNECGVEWPPITLEDVRASVAEFRSEGTFLIAELDGTAVGIGALRMLGPDIAEIKRMYVRKEARGSHLGSALLDNLIDRAKQTGASIVRLDTVRFMTDAQNLYRSRGFTERPPYEGTEVPEPMQEHWLFFERPLDD